MVKQKRMVCDGCEKVRMCLPVKIKEDEDEVVETIYLCKECQAGLYKANESMEDIE